MCIVYTYIQYAHTGGENQTKKPESKRKVSDNSCSRPIYSKNSFKSANLKYLICQRA